MGKKLKILGIESSCDETAAAVVTSDREILSNEIFSQVAEHNPYGGVVPEIAARSHIQRITPVVDAALSGAGTQLEELDAIAVTSGPGLIGGVIVGVMTAKALAFAADKPIVSVNHLEGHALTARLTDEVPFPYLLLLVSGGHCQFLMVDGVGKYTRLGGTLDDALGEAYDKTAKLLGLGYPGGPAVEKHARDGDASAYPYTQPMQGRNGCDMSFSGLKTAVRESVQPLKESGTLTKQAIADVCASFQAVAVSSIAERLTHAIEMFRETHADAPHVVLAGGVAANSYLREGLQHVVEQHDMTLVVPPPKLCTDNAAMIAWAGLERFRTVGPDNLEFDARARWPLTDLNNN